MKRPPHFLLDWRPLTLLAALLVYSLFSGWPAGKVAGQAPALQHLLVADGLYLLIVLAAAGLAVWNAAQHRRLSPYVVAGAFCSLLLAESWMLQYDWPGRDMPDVSVADLLYFGYYIGLAVVLLRLQRRGREWLPRWGWLLDSLLVVLVATEVAWLTFLKETLLDSEVSPVLRGLNLAYVALDLLLLGLAVLALRRHTAPALLLFGVGVLSYVAADFQYFALQLHGTYVAGTPLDLLWAWGTSLQVIAILWAWQRPPAPPLALGAHLSLHQRALLSLPYWAMALSAGLLWFSESTRLHDKNIPQWTVIILVVVMLRQGLTLLERQELSRKLHAQAFHDALTGLPNRAAFDEAMRQLGRVSGPAALFFIDLNGFKPLNDTLGHEAGDQALSEIAQRLRAALLPTAQIFRLGGDEFTVLLHGPGLSRADAEQLLPRLRQAICPPLHLLAGDWSLSASVGLAYVPNASLADAEAMRREADQEMYRDKHAGRGPTYRKPQLSRK